MITWGAFREDAGELGAAGERLLTHPGFGFGYLGTVRADGAPRIHPVMPVIEGEHLEVFVVPSPKLDDLRRDSRYALHSSQSETIDDEFLLTGRATLVEEGERRTAALAALARSVGDHHVLVELLIDGAMWAHYSQPPSWPPTYESWSSRNTKEP